MNINFKEIFLLPNLISLFRLLLFIPFLIFFQRLEENDIYRTYILVLIGVAFLSDLTDGFIARKTNQISELGKILDPLADKLLVALIIINLFVLGKIPTFYFLIIILRDIIIFIGGIFVSKKIGKVLPSNLLGKLTVLSIGFFIIAVVLNTEPSNQIYQLLFYLSILLSLASVVGYTMRAFELISWKKNETNS